MKHKVTVPSVAVATTKFLFPMCYCQVDSDVEKSDVLLVLRILHVFGKAHVQSHVFPCMYWKLYCKKWTLMCRRVLQDCA